MSGKLVRLCLRDFRRHARKDIDFDPGVNVLVADNGRGKSTIIKAVRWVAFNRPAGDSVVRWGKKACRVTLLTDKHEVVRQKKAGNSYALDGKAFKAVGQSVPPEVTAALRLDAVNFQMQADPPFWLALSPGEVAAEMNRVVDLSIIDRSLANAAVGVRDAAGEVKTLDGLLQEAEVRRGRLRWVPDAEADLKEASRLAQEAATARGEARAVRALLERLGEVRAQTRAVPDASRLEAAMARLGEIKKEQITLRYYQRMLNHHREAICELTKMIAQTLEEAERIKPEACPVCGQSLPSRA